MDKLDRLGWVVTRTFEIRGFRFEVRTTSLPFAAWLDDAMSVYRVEGPGAPYYSIVAHGTDEDGEGSRRFHIMYRGAVPVVRTLHLPTLGRVLMQELEAFLYPERDDAAYLEATLVWVNDVPVLVPEPMGPYLGRARKDLEHHGVRLSTAHAMGVDRSTGEVFFPESLLRVRAGAIGALADIAPMNGEGERVQLADPVRVNSVCWLAFGSGHRLIEPLSRGRTLYLLGGSLMNLGRVGGAAVHGLQHLVADARCFAWTGLQKPAVMLESLVNAVRLPPAGHG
jgi:hypothetical protein